MRRLRLSIRVRAAVSAASGSDAAIYVAALAGSLSSQVLLRLQLVAQRQHSADDSLILSHFRHARNHEH